MLGCAAAFADERVIVLRDGIGAAEGRLRGRQQRSYSLSLSAQSIAIETYIDPIRSAAVELYDPDGGRVLLMKEGAGRWRASLAKTGKYALVVVRAVPAAPASYYRIRVSTR